MFGLGSPFCLFRLGSLLYVWAGKPFLCLGWEARFVCLGWEAFFIVWAGKPSL